MQANGVHVGVDKWSLVKILHLKFLQIS